MLKENVTLSNGWTRNPTGRYGSHCLRPERALHFPKISSWGNASLPTHFDTEQRISEVVSCRLRVTLGKWQRQNAGGDSANTSRGMPPVVPFFRMREEGGRGMCRSESFSLTDSFQ